MTIYFCFAKVKSDRKKLARSKLLISDLERITHIKWNSKSRRSLFEHVTESAILKMKGDPIGFSKTNHLWKVFNLGLSDICISLRIISCAPYRLFRTHCACAPFGGWQSGNNDDWLLQRHLLPFASCRRTVNTFNPLATDFYHCHGCLL